MLAATGVAVAAAAALPELAGSYAATFGLASVVTEAHVRPGHGSSSKSLSIEVRRGVRDLDENRARTFAHHMTFDPADGWVGGSGPVGQEIPSHVAASLPSPSGRRTVRVVKVSPSGGGEGTWCLELWNDGALEARVSGAAKHQAIRASPLGLGGLAWAPNEEKVVYVAEKKTRKDKSNSFFKLPGKAAADEPAVAGEQYEYQEHWGEKLTTSHSLGLFVLDVETETIEEVTGIADDVTPAQPQFVHGGQSILYVAFKHEPRRLGLVYCFQRPCDLRLGPAPTHAPLAPADDAGAAPGQAAEPEEHARADHLVLTPNDAVSFSPRVNGEDERVAFLASSSPFDTHVGAMQLKVLTVPPLDQVGAATTDVEPATTLLDVVETPDGVLPEAWPGLFAMHLPASCWSHGHIWTTAFVGSRASAVVVDPRGGRTRVSPLVLADHFPGVLLPATARDMFDCEGCPGVTEAANDASVSVLTALDLPSSKSFPPCCGALVSWSTPTNPGGLALLLLDESSKVGNEYRAVPCPVLGPQTITSSPITREQRRRTQDAVTGLHWSLLRVTPPLVVSGPDAEAANGSVPATVLGAADDTQPPFEAVLVHPPTPGSEDAPAPGLIVVPHGGPHSLTPTSFIPSYAFVALATGCAVLHINYRGSIGFGKQPLDSLPGKIGEQDVADVVAATQGALALKLRGASTAWLDPNKVAVVGGSHGGFLAGHLVGQFPELYKAAALRNPVTNIPSMVGVTDIPDWCHVEATGSYDFGRFTPASPAALAAMYRRSPVAHVGRVRAPTLVALGLQDRRVPPSQGHEFYHVLKAAGVPVRMLCYPEDTHAIDKPASEADHWLNIVNWLNEHLAV